MVALVTRFEELLAPTANGGGPSEDAADAGAGAELVPVPLGRSQHAMNLTNAAHQITHHSMSLQKTRLHFQKVRPAQRSDSSALACAFLCAVCLSRPSACLQCPWQPAGVEEAKPSSEGAGDPADRAARGALQDVRRQMYNADDDRNFFDWIQRELRAVEKRLEEGRACLAHLELALINVACDDPGAAVGTQLALPLLQERLDGRARAFAAQRAAAAQEAIIRAEVRCACCRVLGWVWRCASMQRCAWPLHRKPIFAPRCYLK